LRDAVELEWAGVPSLPIVHTEMAGSARAIARISGHAEYPFLTVGHPWIPTAVWTPDEVADLADRLAPLVADALLGRFPEGR
jgi:hypothetical protein